MKRSTVYPFTLSPCRRATLPRGMAVITVVIMLVLVSAAVTAMTLLFATEARRTHEATAGAQLRQLLLAAEPAALDELQRHDSAARDVTIPTPVASATLTLHITPAGGDQAQVHVLAKSTRDQRAQTLTFTRTTGRWQLHSAELRFQP